MARARVDRNRWSGHDTLFVALVMAFGILAAAAGVAFAVPGPGFELSAAPSTAIAAPASR